jgi:hypothetical protein
MYGVFVLSSEISSLEDLNEQELQLADDASRIGFKNFVCRLQLSSSQMMIPVLWIRPLKKMI